MDFMDPQVYSLLSAWYAFYEEHCLLRSPLLCSVSSSDPPPQTADFHCPVPTPPRCHPLTLQTRTAYTPQFRVSPRPGAGD